MPTPEQLRLFATPLVPDGELPPHQRHSDTSREAAERVQPIFRGMTLRVYRAILACPEGITDQELQVALRMSGNSERPCRIALVKSGRVRDSGRRRRTKSGNNAVVWEVTDA